MYYPNLHEISLLLDNGDNMEYGNNKTTKQTAIDDYKMLSTQRVLYGQ